MNRYELLAEEFYQRIESHVYGLYKQKAYFHSIQVMQTCIMLASKKNLNQELAAIIGLYHDFSQFYNQNSFNHAKLSSYALLKILEKYDFSDEEKEIMIHAIENHSDKKSIHDSYSELIKDADLLVKYYNDPSIVFKDYEQQRIHQYIK